MMKRIFWDVMLSTGKVTKKTSWTAWPQISRHGATSKHLWLFTSHHCI